MSPEAVTSAAVSHDGKRLAYVAGRIQWNIVEVRTSDGRVRTLHASGGVSGHSVWAPDGARYLFAAYRGGRWSIEEASAAERFSRRVIEMEKGDVGFLQSAPDGIQFTFAIQR